MAMGGAWSRCSSRFSAGADAVARKKLHAVRDKQGRFKDIQSYERLMAKILNPGARRRNKTDAMHLYKRYFIKGGALMVHPFSPDWYVGGQRFGDRALWFNR
jgi:hypothetical protein